MQAVILAGGLGTRLRPLTHKVPKPMVPILGRPFLWYQLSSLKKQGFKNIVFLIGYLGEQIRDYFQDGSCLDLNIQYSREDKPLGTGGALKHASNLLDKEFFLLYGDSFLPADYQKIKQVFKSTPHLGLAVVYNNEKNTSVQNNIALDKNNIIIEYNKESCDAHLKYVEAGVLAFQKNVLSLIPTNQQTSLEKEVFPRLISKRQFNAFITSEKFYDIGTPERLKNFTKYLKNTLR